MRQRVELLAATNFEYPAIHDHRVHECGEIRVNTGSIRGLPPHMIHMLVSNAASCFEFVEGGGRKVITCIEDSVVISAILTHLAKKRKTNWQPTPPPGRHQR